jgi:hypothetical protein
MTATSFPSFAAPIRALFRLEDSIPVRADQNDPALNADRMGTRCRLHNSPRHLDEAPLVPIVDQDMSFHSIKHREFPHSWTAIGSYAATAEGRGIIGRLRRPRMVVVRYCQECRDAAENWMKSRE